MEWFSRILHFIVLPFVAISYVLTPLTNDARIYLGVENIADKFFPFPQGLDLAWEIKPMANRVINYIFLKIATLVVPMENHFWFGVAVKLLALLVVIAVAWYFARQINLPYTFAITFLAFTTCANFFIMQAEYWATLFSILCIALLLKRTPMRGFAAGILIPVIGLFKGISGIMFISILCAVFLLNDEQYKTIWEYLNSYRYFIAGVASGAIAFFALQLSIWPHMLPDILMSPWLSNAGHLSPWISSYHLTLQTIILPLYLPILCVAIAIGVFYIARIRYLNDRNTTIAYFLMWVTPFVAVIPQGEYFMYQFEMLILPAIVTLILAERCLRNET